MKYRDLTRIYPSYTYIRWMAAYSAPCNLGLYSALLVMDDFGNLVSAGYCHWLTSEPEPLEIEFRQLSFADIGAE